MLYYLSDCSPIALESALKPFLEHCLQFHLPKELRNTQ
jgi:hypothetical protein